MLICFYNVVYYSGQSLDNYNQPSWNQYINLIYPTCYNGTVCNNKLTYDRVYCLSDVRDGSHGRKVRLIYTYQAPVYVISLLIKVFIKLTLKLIFVY